MAAFFHFRTVSDAINALTAARQAGACAENPARVEQDAALYRHPASASRVPCPAFGRLRRIPEGRKIQVRRLAVVATADAI